MSSQSSCSRENYKDIFPNKRYTHQDGYEVSFVKQPPQELQLECSICLQLLSDPCLLDCECGNHFCRKCIATVKASSSQCPLCKEDFQIVLPNKQLGRTLNGLLVHCPHSEEGCSWVDELAKLSEHFNQTPSKDARLEGCAFIDVMCMFCKEWLPRKNIPKHETELCPNKPYTCQYCGHISILNDIMENHWPLCPKFPLPCPNECGESPPREELERHVTSVCGLALEECVFKHAGCEVGELPRREMAGHLTDNLVEHTSLLAIKQSEEIEALRRENQSLKENVEALKEVLVSVKKECSTLKPQISSVNALELDRQVQDLASCMSRIPFPTPPQSRVPPVELVMKNFRRLRDQKNTWSSSPFYSEKGYKMLLRVYPFGNGSGWKSHISVYVHLLVGEDDDILRWPFRGEITVTLINQWHGRHHSVTVDFSDDNVEEECGERRDDNCLTNGLGWNEFIEYRWINEYLRNDCLVFRIDNICNEW